MGISLEQLMEAAEKLKEKVYYYIDCNPGMTNEIKTELKSHINGLLDSLDELK